MCVVYEVCGVESVCVVCVVYGGCVRVGMGYMYVQSVGRMLAWGMYIEYVCGAHAGGVWYTYMVYVCVACVWCVWGLCVEYVRVGYVCMCVLRVCMRCGHTLRKDSTPPRPWEDCTGPQVPPENSQQQ